MVFSSIPFLFFFFPLFLIIYYLVPFKHKGIRWKNIVLLIFSLIFYAWGEPVYILLMIFSSLVDYYSGKMINKYWHEPKIKKLFLILSIIINLGLLGFFKYADFLIENINVLFSLNIEPLKLGLPIGISFFTFQTMSYSIDVYRGKVNYEKDFLTFMTYVCMFPQLIAGPIVRYETVSEELHRRKINYSKFNSGLIRFLQGLFKKVLIANNIGMLWSEISTLPSGEVTMVMAWLGIIAFALQIYFDFSGYSDMAIGMGKMLGFNYLENFNYPYIAKSITDFWRRWHISLSTFFKDYVYIPLGGSRVSKVLNIRNILIVWTLTGIWHGASWNFVLWGLYFGIILVIEKFVLDKWLKRQNDIVKHTYAILLILIGWAIFASSDMLYPKEYLLTMFLGFKNFISTKTLYYFANYFLIILIGIILSTPVYIKFNKWLNSINKKYMKIISFIIITSIFVILFFITIAYLVSDTYNPFLYFRF